MHNAEVASMLGTMVLHLQHAHAAVSRPLDLHALADINGAFLQLLVDAAQVGGDPPIQFVDDLREPLLRLEPKASSVAAQIPFLLIDIEFRNPAWWKSVAAEASRSAAAQPTALHVPRVRALKLARSALMLAWHVARADPESGIVAIGMSSPVMAVVSALRPQQIERISERHYGRLRPRWEERPDLWRQLICGAHDEGNVRAFTLRALSTIALQTGAP